jgi:histidinol-phosphate phosphatase family protein
MKEIVLIIGAPGSGKTTLATAEFPTYTRLNRDSMGGSLAQVAAKLAVEITKSHEGFVLDNTYPNAKTRKLVVDVAKAHGVPVRCIHLNSTIEQAQYNACERMVRQFGRLLMPHEIDASKDPNTFPIAVLFRYRKEFESPSPSEGFAKIETRPFVRKAQAAEYNNKAAIFDYDGTLRCTKSGDKYPLHPDDVAILPGRSEALKLLQSQGYKLLGISNQSGVADAKLTHKEADACFKRTNELLGVEIEYCFCPHKPAPISCYCRKPVCGLAVHLIEKHRLDRAQTFFVGDATSDKTMASRAMISYKDQAEFFK